MKKSPALIIFFCFFSLAASYPTPTEKQTVSFHLTFPYDGETGSDFVLNTEFANAIILSNFVAGVMYSHLVRSTYNGIQMNDDYFIGSLIGQLLQESGLDKELINADFNASADSQFINNPTEKGILLSIGQGGPYQINDYSMRLGVVENGALGLINYDAVRKSLGYTIADQDNGTQTKKGGPESLDDVYFGPMATAFYHFNDFRRMQSNSNTTWYQYRDAWTQCMTNLRSPSLTEEGLRLTDFVMNVVYNAGDYSPVLGAYLDICVSLNETELKEMNSYLLDPAAYRAAIGSSMTYGDSYFRYPRQVSFYLDQIYGKNMSAYNIDTVNRIVFSVKGLSDVFTKVIRQLSYKSKGTLAFYQNSVIEQAFQSASDKLGVNSDDQLKMYVNGDREVLFRLVKEAINAVETISATKFSDFTN